MNKDKFKDIIETAAVFGCGIFTGWIWRNVWEHCPRWDTKENNNKTEE